MTTGQGIAVFGIWISATVAAVYLNSSFPIVMAVFGTALIMLKKIWKEKED